MRDNDPAAHVAVATGLAVRFSCPVCTTEYDSYIDTAPTDSGCFEVEADQQFDLCSHCGALLDFGGFFRQEFT